MAKKQNFDITAMLMALAGGAGSSVATKLAEDKIDYFMNNPKVTPAAVGAIAAGGLYFMNEPKYDPFFYGMLGGAGADITNQFMADKAATKSGADLSNENFLPPLIDPPSPGNQLPPTTQNVIFEEDGENFLLT